MKPALIVLAVFWFAPVFSQSSCGPRIAAMGGAGSALQEVWSVHANQAGIALLTKATASVSYQNQFLNPELSTKSAALVFPYKHNAFGLGFESYGFSVYKQEKAVFSYAKNMGEKLFVSLGFNYHQIKIQQYGNAQAYSFEVGMQYYLSGNLLLGVHISNPTNGKFSSEVNVLIPFILEAGASYRFTDKLLITMDTEKEINLNLDFKTGLEYKAVPWFALRGGISTNPFTQYAGVGISYKSFFLDTAIASYQTLGISPQIAVSYEF